MSLRAQPLRTNTNHAPNIRNPIPQRIIPQGQYGAGTVTIWDRGGLVVEDLRENEKILFELSGNKMQGRYALIKAGFGGQKKNWLFFKRK